MLLWAGAFSEAAWCLLELRRASEDSGASASHGAVEQRGSLLAEVAARALLLQGATWAVGVCRGGHACMSLCACVRNATAQGWLSARPIAELHVCCGAMHHLVSGCWLVRLLRVVIAAASCGWHRHDPQPASRAAPSLSNGLWAPRRRWQGR